MNKRLKTTQSRFYIFGHSDYIKYSLSDILSDDNVNYIDFFQADPNIVRFLLSKKTPSFIKLIFWKYLSRNFKGFRFIGKPSPYDVFILYEKNYFSRDKTFLNYLRKYSPKGKIAFIETNLLSEQWKKNNLDTFEMITSGQYYDEVITFNKPDADQFGFRYFQFVNSKCKFCNDIDAAVESDVFFCGRDKGRGGKLEQIFVRLTQGGMKCNFILIKDETSEKEYADGIHVLDHSVPNIDVLKNMSRSKCILDLAFDRTSPGQSLRFSEAIAYEKLLLTDNPFTTDNELFHAGQMMVIENAGDIDVREIEEKLKKKDYLSPDVVSPKKLLKFVRNIDN